MATVLVTDGQQRKALSAARSLGRAGHRVLVAEATWFATAGFSKYTNRGLVSPDAAANPDRYARWLSETVGRYGVDCVLPMDDATTEVVANLGEALPAAALVPTPEQFRTGRDKGRTMELAARAGVRTPRTAPNPQAALAAGFGWPVVIKARRGSGARGIHRIADAAELISVYDAGSPSIVQEYIPPGRKFDVCLLFSSAGELVTSFVQEELRGYPLWGGPSTLQESVHRPDLVALSLRLLEPIGWRGPVEIEYMEDPSGQPVLMEINPRFWASLDLAVRCGIDFPRWTAELALGLAPTVPSGYPAGRRCRWLLPGDILHFLANPERFRMTPPFWRTLDERTHDDILSWDDPGPTLGFLLASVRHALDLRMWRMLIR